MAASVDAKLAILLKNSAEAALLSSKKSQPGTKKFSMSMIDAYFEYLRQHGPEVLNIGFCGSHEAVSNSLLSALSSYFSRSITQGNDNPVWVDEILPSPRYGKVSVLMLLTSLKIAEIEFDVNTFLAGLNE